jgi:hypothetical protein
MKSARVPSENCQLVAPLAVTPASKHDLAVVGSLPLLPGEDADQYNQILREVFDTVKPVDIFERIWVRSGVDFVWEAFRYRRLISELFLATKQQALERVLRQLIHGGASTQSFYMIDDAMLTRPEELARGYALNHQDAVDEIDQLLNSAGLTLETINAEALSLRMDEIERLNRMITMSEVRRDATLREIERHRANFGAKLRRAAEQVEDAEYKDVEEIRADERRAA